jgi:hypothetical protein
VAFTPITLVCRNIRYYVAVPGKATAAGAVPADDADREVAGKLQLLKARAAPPLAMGSLGGVACCRSSRLGTPCDAKACWRRSLLAAQGISIYAQPGNLTALMVSSRAHAHQLLTSVAAGSLRPRPAGAVPAAH